MKERRVGRIVFVSSQAGQLGIFGYSAYSASKFALRGLAEALQMEVRAGVSLSHSSCVFFFFEVFFTAPCLSSGANLNLMFDGVGRPYDHPESSACKASTLVL